ncbi:MAG: hypothetical protein HYU52_11175 [Acidobacteria bacterium]|nr:hypothetical protein [Acidobacteriota bacterium]
MRSTGTVARFSLILLVAGTAAGMAHAQSGVGIEVKEVSDSRSRVGNFGGNLELKLVLTGSGLEKVAQARVVVKSATDDKGTALMRGGEPADFRPRDWNMGELSVTLRNPARSAKSLRIAGNVELFVPSKDPSSIVKIDKPLTKLDKPLSAKALKAEKLSFTLLSPKKYEERSGAGKLDDAKIAETRAQAKKEGVSDAEIDAMIELAKALRELGGGTPSEGAVIIAGKEPEMDRILQVRLLKPDGSEVSIPSRSSSTSGGETIMVASPSEPVPPDAVLELTLLTKKSTMSIPFELKNVALP